MTTPAPASPLAATGVTAARSGLQACPHYQVHRAIGMVAGQLNVGMADAFAHLRARAFAEQVPLSALASDIVARRRRFDHDGGPP